jgi:aspartate kinase
MATKRAFYAIKLSRTETMLTVIGVPDVPGMAARLFSALADAKIPIVMVVQNAPDAGSAAITFTVWKQNADAAHDIVRAKAEELGAEGLMRDDHIARLAVRGTELDKAVGLAGAFFTLLADHGINVLAINTTTDLVSCIIEEVHSDVAVEILKKKFDLTVESPS